VKNLVRATLLVLLAAAFIFAVSSAARRSPYPVEDLAGATWARVLSWRFVEGQYPAGWGWGRRTVVDGTLELSTVESGMASTYFLPVAHGSEFILETEFMLVEGAGGQEAGVHLATRDTGAGFNETGIAVFARGRPVYYRHRVHRLDDAAEFVRSGPFVEYGTWHAIRVELRNGRLSGSVDGQPVFSREVRTARTLYTEPHVAVENGTARFRAVRVYTTPGFRVSRASAGAGPVGARPYVPPGAEPTTPGTELARRLGWWVRVIEYSFYVVIFIVCVYTIRHYVFTLNRLFGNQRHPYLDVDVADWPRITVLVPAHNEELVIGEVLDALVRADYPAGRLRILPINDRSRDRTGEIVDDFAQRHPGLITPFHRKEGKSGKAAALQDAMALVEDDIVLVFDADYIPGQGLLKQLAAPFFDPEIGAVMGRVVPHNVEHSLLTRSLDLERAGGYQVDQQARMNLNLVPQYGGTVGGIRKRALESVGGWNVDSLTEDTDATLRLVLRGWKVAYQNRSECYEQVPENWPMRIRQLSRWVRGHNQTLAKHWSSLFANRFVGFRERFDTLLLLNIYAMAVVLVIGWFLGITLWFLGVNRPGLIVILAVTSYSTLGNFAVFFEIAAATYLDGSTRRVRLLPFVLFGFLVSLFTVTRVTVGQAFPRRREDNVFWHKTEHTNGHNGNGHLNGNGYGNGKGNGHRNGDGDASHNGNRNRNGKATWT
jgi:cellulose synthase/poly-beta-1,6-N-acetylglucosamine synthase-like glycosyltransferase